MCKSEFSSLSFNAVRKLGPFHSFETMDYISVIILSYLSSGPYPSRIFSLGLVYPPYFKYYITDMMVDVSKKSQEDERGTDPFSCSLEAVRVEEES